MNGAISGVLRMSVKIPSPTYGCQIRLQFVTVCKLKSRLDEAEIAAASVSTRAARAESFLVSL